MINLGKLLVRLFLFILLLFFCHNCIPFRSRSRPIFDGSGSGSSSEKTVSAAPAPAPTKMCRLRRLRLRLRIPDTKHIQFFMFTKKKRRCFCATAKETQGDVHLPIPRPNTARVHNRVQNGACKWGPCGVVYQKTSGWSARLNVLNAPLNSKPWGRGFLFEFNQLSGQSRWRSGRCWWCRSVPN